MLEQAIKSREQAIVDGDLFYFTGKACRKGHLSRRYVSSCNCVDCSEATRKKSARKVRKFRRIAAEQRLQQTQSE